MILCCLRRRDCNSPIRGRDTQANRAQRKALPIMKRILSGVLTREDSRGAGSVGVSTSIECVELSRPAIWQGNCFQGIESTFYNSFAISEDGRGRCGVASQLPCQMVSRPGPAGRNESAA